MRILYIANPGAEDRIFGSHRALLNLIKGVIAKPDNTVAVLVPRKGVLTEELKNLGVKYYCTHRYRLSRLPSFKPDIGLAKRLFVCGRMIIERNRIQNDLAKVISDFNPDIVHTNVGPLDIADRICEKMDIPHVWHLREFQGNESSISTPFPGVKSYQKRIQSKNNYMIGITKGVFNHFNLGKKDRVIYDGVFEKKSIRDYTIHNSKKDFFLFTGRIDENKDILFLLNSYKKYLNNGGTTKLHIAGAATSNKYFNKCQDFVQKNNIGDSVTFLGFRNDVYDLMQNAKALIVTSRFEGFGFITAEAMYNKCLVIGRDLTGTKEQFDNGLRIAGKEIALRFKNERELSKCLKIADSHEDEVMIKNAFEVVNSLYSSQEHCNKVLSYYNDILAEKVAKN